MRRAHWGIPQTDVLRTYAVALANPRHTETCEDKFSEGFRYGRFWAFDRAATTNGDRQGRIGLQCAVCLITASAFPRILAACERFRSGHGGSRSHNELDDLRIKRFGRWRGLPMLKEQRTTHAGRHSSHNDPFRTSMRNAAGSPTACVGFASEAWA